MHARFYSPLNGRFLSVDPARSAARDAPQSWNRYAYGRNNPANRIDPDGKVDRRSDEDRRITENPVVLKTSGQLIATTSSNAEYGALVGEKTNGDFVSSGIYTSNHPGQVSHLQAVEKDKSGNVTIKDTGIAPTRTLHTHLTSGKAYPVPGTNQNFTPTATDEPSTNDKTFAQGTGVAGYIVVPSAKVLVKVKTDGTYEVVLSKRDYRKWAKRARKAK